MKITSSNPVAENLLDAQVNLLLEAGGYIHPGLVLHVGENAEHGELSLSGVDSNDISIRLPVSVAVNFRKADESLWFQFIKKIYSLSKVDIFRTRSAYGFLLPLIDMANHNKDSKPIQFQNNDFILHGSTCCYSLNGNSYLSNFFGFEDA